MNQLNKIVIGIWANGSSQPLQRIGLIILAIGIFSCIFWVFESPNYYNIIDILFDPRYYPGHSDALFYKLYIYFIPLGLILSWGYPFLKKIKSWVLKEPTNDNFLYFQKRNELTEFISNNWDFKKANNKPALGYISKVLSPDESYKEALELGLINVGDSYVLHTDVLLITKYGEELVFAPCDALGADLKVGDFVLLATLGNEKRQDWHYVLIAKLKPIYNATKKGWVIESDYRIK